VVKSTDDFSREDRFSLPLLTACSLFRLKLPFTCINFFENEKEVQRLLFGSSFDIKASLVLFLLFELGNCSTISLVMVVLVTIVTPIVGTLVILRRLAYTYWLKMFNLLVVKKDSDCWCA
jgi:hypothetical protein